MQAGFGGVGTLIRRLGARTLVKSRGVTRRVGYEFLNVLTHAVIVGLRCLKTKLLHLMGI